jgi:MFS family permease
MSEPTVVEVAAPREALFSREFVVLLITQVCFGMSFSAMFLLPKYLKLALFASDAQVGSVQATGAIAGVLTFPVVGVLNDRFGRKPLLLAGSALMTYAAYATLSLTEVNLWFYVLRALQGMGFAMFFNSAATLTTDRVSPENLGRALAVFGASMLFTNAAAPASSEPLTELFGWPILFWLSVAWGLVSMVMGLFVDEPVRARTDKQQSAAGLFELLRSPRARQVLMIIAATGAGFGTVFTFYQPYALSRGITVMSGLFVYYAASALLVRLVLMSYIERQGRKRVSAICIVLYAVGVFATAFMRPGMLEVIGAILGTAQGVFYPVFNAIAVEGIPPQQRGSMMALYHGGFNAGTALLMAVGGPLAERVGYPALFFSTGSLTVLAALVLWRSTLFPEGAR